MAPLISGLVLREKVSVCGFQAHQTQVDNLLIVIADTGMQIKRLTPSKIDLLLHMKAGFAHSFITSELETEEAIAKVALALCRRERRSLLNQLALVQSGTQGRVKLSGLPDTGVMYVRAGVALHIIECERVNVTRRNTQSCTQVRRTVHNHSSPRFNCDNV